MFKYRNTIVAESAPALVCVVPTRAMRISGSLAGNGNFNPVNRIGLAANGLHDT